MTGDRTQWVPHTWHYIVGMHTIRARSWSVVTLACLAFPTLASATCYQLFDKKNRLVLQSSTAPVDTSRSLRDEVDRLYPGHFLIMSAQAPCVEIDELSRQVTALPTTPLDRGPIRIAPESDSIGAGKSSGSSAAGRSGASLSTGSSSRATPWSPSPCYVGPEGGTFTRTKSGKKNYNGC